MADEQNQNQQKQKGGNAPKNGISMGTAVSASNNFNLGETIRGAVADSFGFMMGAIFTGIASWGLNQIIAKVKPGTKTPALFPGEGSAPSAPTSRELMGQMHQLAKTDPEGVKRILDSVGSRFNKNDDDRPSVPAVPTKELAPVAPKQDVPTPTPAPVQDAEPKSKQPKSKK